MTDGEFKSTLNEFKVYLEPALYKTLSENADIFSDETKKEIIAHLVEADEQAKGHTDH